MALLTQGQQHLRRCALSCARTHSRTLTHTRVRSSTDRPSGRYGELRRRACFACVRASRYSVSYVRVSHIDRRTDGRASFKKSIVIVIPPCRYRRAPFILAVQSSVAAVATCCGTRRVSRLRVIHRRSARLVEPGNNVCKPPRFL